MSKRTFTGKVVSTKMNKTVVVEVAVPKQHDIYRKALKMTKRFLAHNTDIKLVANDMVEIEESRPYGKNVAWTVVKKLEEAKK